MNGRKSQLTLLLLLILCFSGIAVADSGSGNHESNIPNKVVQLSEGDETNTSITKEFKRGQWKKLEGPEGGYYVCEGEFRSKTGGRCEELVNHWVGKWEVRKELPLKAALELEAGNAIALQTIEHFESSIWVKYAVTNDPMDKNVLIALQAASKVADEANKAIRTFPNSRLEFNRVLFEFASPVIKSIGFGMAILSLMKGLYCQSAMNVLYGIASGLLVMIIPALLQTTMGAYLLGDSSNNSTVIDTQSNYLEYWKVSCAITTYVFICIGISKLFSSPREADLDQQRQEQLEPVSIDELRERQEEAEESSNEISSSSRPQVISESKSESSIEFVNNKRKVILD